MLKAKQFAAFKARDAYHKLVNDYGFDPEKEKAFSYRQLLFAPEASKEGYSCIFISHSNWTKTKGGRWENTIYGNLEKIEEKYLSEADYPKNDSERRVVFAKDSNSTGGYRFLGVYDVAGFNKATGVRTYKRISEVYPLAEDAA